MTVRGFEELAEAMRGRVAGSSRIGLTFVAACPACGTGRLLAWTRRPGFRGHGYRCADCGRRGDLVGLDLLLRRAAA